MNELVKEYNSLHLLIRQWSQTVGVKNVDDPMWIVHLEGVTSICELVKRVTF